MSMTRFDVEGMKKETAIYQNGFALWVCPKCGFTIRWPSQATSLPNTICQGPHLDDAFYEMVLVWDRVILGERPDDR